MKKSRWLLLERLQAYTRLTNFFELGFAYAKKHQYSY